MQVAQTEILCLVDDDGIGVRYVDTALDNGGGEQNVIIIVDKIENNLLQFGRFHLSVTDTDTAIGNVALYHRFQFRKIGDTVVYKEHLSVAAHFEVNGISDNLITESMHLRLNGVTVGRRRLNNA